MKIVYTLFIWCIATFVAQAQGLERPAAFDSTGRIMEWTKKLESGAKLFPDVDGFRRALLWQGDSSCTLEMDTERGRIRRNLARTGLDSLRQRVQIYLSTQGSRYALNQDGRGAYLLWQIPLSLGWYGPAVVVIVNPSSGVTGMGLYLTSAAASYYVPFVMTRNSQVTPGQEHLSIAGGFRGIAAGGALAVLTGSDDASLNSGIMLLTSVAGQMAGYRWGKQFTKPQGRIISHYASFGMTDVPLLLGAVVKDLDEHKKLMAAGSLAGLAGGTWMGHRLAAGMDIPDGNPTIIANSGWAGIAAGLGTYLFLNPPDSGVDFNVNSRALLLSCLVGNATGLGLGHRLVRGYAFTRSEGYLVIGTTAGGALFGAGVGFLVSPRNDSDGGIRSVRTIAGLSTLGLAGGYALGMATVRKPYNRTPRPTGLRLELNPMGPAMAAARRPAAVPWITGTF